MSTGSVRLESRGALALLTIGAPPLNRIDAQVIAGLRAALDEVERVEGPRALVVRGAGDVFSAGADVSLFDGLGPDQAEELIGGFLELGDRIERLPFPTLAAVHGQCIAGGLELALFYGSVTRRKPARVPNRVPKARLFGRPDGFRAGPRSGWASVRGSQWPE